jgi:very-short-patch-repair endonuclease
VPHAKLDEWQRGRAKQLRQKMTRAENLLWRYLKAHHVDGYAFRRQTPMRQYIVDFVCHSAKLIVEVDGVSHDSAQRQEEDRRRNDWFASQGYAVLRFSDEQVLKNLEGVIEVVRERVSIRLKGAPPSPPSPTRGEGAIVHSSAQTK